MREYTFMDDIFSSIENCASIDYIINQIDKNKDKVDKEDIIKIIRYYLSFK